MAESKRFGHVRVRSIVALGLVTLLAAGCAEDLVQPSRVAPPALSLTSAAPTLTVTDLGTFGGTESWAYGINEPGEVVGYIFTVRGDLAMDPQTDFRAFRWKDGAMTGLGTLGGRYSYATGINNGGVVVGYSETAGNGPEHAFGWKDGTMTDLGTLGGTASRAYGINDAGEVVGVSATGSGATHAFRWRDGVMTDLGTLGDGSSWATGINDAGEVVGYSGTAVFKGASHAFRWKDGTMADLGTLGGRSSFAYGINDAGEVIGYSETTDAVENGAPRAFRWKDGAMTDLGTLGGTLSWATGINNVGEVVGYSLTPGNSATHAFRWKDGAMTDLGVLPGGPDYSVAQAINDGGQIAGLAGGAADGAGHAVLWSLTSPIADLEPPTITASASVTVEAISRDATPVYFDVTATDNVGVASLSCDHASGSPFPLGSTTVTCVATDAAGNAATAQFTVTVVDTTPPVIATPGNIVVDATSPSGALVSYSVSATDAVDLSATVACTPSSGNVFAIGTTTVSCTAMDESGNTSAASFTVTVNSASSQVEALQEAVAGLDLQEGTETSVQAKLVITLDQLSSNNVAAACGTLDALINQVTAQIGKKISAEDAAALIAAAERLRAAAGC